jgi:flagellar motility protein MotE (MotC chaperone)
MTSPFGQSAVDRILLSETIRSRRNGSTEVRRSSLWTIAAGVVGATILLWVMVQLGQASPTAKEKPSQPPTTSSPAPSPAQPDSAGAGQQAAAEDESSSWTPPVPAIHGPVLEAPRELMDMLDSRIRDLDRREETLRRDEGRLMMVRDDIEKLLAQNEALEKRIRQATGKDDQQVGNAKAQKAKALIEKERHQQEQRVQLAKMYEAMPPEDAATRLEHMPDPKAIEILRLIKTKTAGLILAQVKPERAAKLTEQLLAQAK